ncbi:MAG: hypothetical protein QW244_01725 [Candidatus Pacearchaeota archaeon]
MDLEKRIGYEEQDDESEGSALHAVSYMIPIFGDIAFLCNIRELIKENNLARGMTIGFLLVKYSYLSTLAYGCYKLINFIDNKLL